MSSLLTQGPQGGGFSSIWKVSCALNSGRREERRRTQARLGFPLPGSDLPVCLPPGGTSSVCCTWHPFATALALPGAPFPLPLLDRGQLVCHPQGPDMFLSLRALLASL